MADMAKLLEEYGAGAEATADELLEASPAFVAQPTQTHVNLVNMLDEILSLATAAASGEQGHPLLRTTLRTVRHLKPVALEELARVPEAEVREFMRRLVAMMLRSIGEEGTNGGTAHAGALESPPAGAGAIGGGDADR